MHLAGIKWSLIPLFTVAAVAGGCNPVPPPNGPLQAVQPVSDQPRLGSVYIVRGLLGNFSTGMDELQEDLQNQGVRAIVYQHLQAGSLAKTLAQRYRSAGQREPLVLVGHSLGADDVVDISKQLEAEHVPVQLLVTVDPVYAGAVPANVQHTVNYYCSNGPLDLLPALRGIPIKRRPDASGPLENIDIRGRGELSNALTNHFTIDSNPKVRHAIVQRVLGVCTPRAQSLAATGGRRPTTIPAMTAWQYSE